MRREQSMTVWPAGLASRAPEAVRSLRCGLRDSLAGRREGLTANVSGPTSLGSSRSSLEGQAGGEQTGQGDGCQGARRA